ncbi:pyridoxamine 5'-phosphate oxidase family protein [Haloarchaeobius sp. TZWWS8]|uniref:pyridoxamine 5'-phosphate oxidase family protein n=1 Tax=Haloarchaeobius sp. TZWWS8 TaxID=3446121 RepID=UPI003EC03202
MEDIRAVRMDADERDEFLGPGGTGVISFSAGAESAPESLPVSYGYDAEEAMFYFRLSAGDDDAKTPLVNRDRPVSFVTHRKTDDGWKSVVVKGNLYEVTEGSMGTEILERMRHVQIPLVDVFDRDPREVAFRFFRLEPFQFGARKEARSED